MGTVLIIGASTGIGAIYSDERTHHGNDLIMVALDLDGLNTLDVQSQSVMEQARP